MNMSELTPEQREKVLTCKTPRDLLTLAQEEGHELTDDELETVSGGATKRWLVLQCPKCYGVNYVQEELTETTLYLRCLDCDYVYAAE